MGRGHRRTGLILDEAFDGTTASLVLVRAAVAAAVEAVGLDRDGADRFKLVANELATNAIEASPGLPYHLTIDAREEELIITVRNQAPISELPPRREWEPSELLAQRGRGLSIVDAVAESVELSQSNGRWLEISARLKPVPSE